MCKQPGMDLKGKDRMCMSIQHKWQGAYGKIHTQINVTYKKWVNMAQGMYIIMERIDWGLHEISYNIY